MLLNVSKRTPRGPKWLIGDEYTGKSQLHGGEYTGDHLVIVIWVELYVCHISRLPGDEYTWESRLPCDEYTGESIS